MSNELVMIITGGGLKFIGKMADGDDIVLHDAISVTDFITERGLGIIGTIIGTVTFYKDDFILCNLDSKSSYYENYYKTTSNISIAPTGMQPIKRQ